MTTKDTLANYRLKKSIFHLTAETEVEEFVKEEQKKSEQKKKKLWQALVLSKEQYNI